MAKSKRNKRRREKEAMAWDAFSQDDALLSQERNRARDLRQTQWWKRELARGVCHYCGRKTPPAELTMDHVVPISRGGKSVKGNVVPCCKECNNNKKSLLPMEWDQYLEQVRRDDSDKGE